MKKIEWKTLLKNRKVKKALIGVAIGLVVVAVIVTAAVLLDAGTVKLINSNPEAGNVSGGGRISNGASTTIHAVANDGYAFLNWANPDGTVASTEADHTLIVPKSTIELTANWALIQYPITLHLNSEEPAETQTKYPATVNVKDETIFLDTPIYSGYTFLGWYKDQALTEAADDFIPAGTTAAVTLYARWAKSYEIVYDLGGGSNNPENPETYTEDKDVELKHPVYYHTDENGKLTGGSYKFLGWVDEDGKQVTKIDRNWKKPLVLTATWGDKVVYYNSYEADGATYVEYGRYPQHILEDKRTISELKKGIKDGTLKADESGMYSYQNTLYVKVTAKPYQNDAKTYFSKFSDGSDVKEGEDYFFVVEPIVWKVISGDINDPNAELQLLSVSVLSAMPFNEDPATRMYNGLPIYANNWEFSDIRAFLNGEFLDTAFKAGEKSFLQTTTVDYSKETVNQDGKATTYANGDKCTDIVYLLSYQDMLNSDYGWSSSKYKEDIKKTAKATDYAKAKGVYASVNDGDEHDNAHWWLRSAANFDDFAAATNALGGVGSDRVKLDLIGVRPVLKVKFGANA